MSSPRLQHPRLGLDSTGEIGIGTHRRLGSTFAIRYLSRYSWKVLTASEVASYHRNGLDICVVFEDGAQNALGGYGQGVSDATFAREQARALGMPAGRPIYFAVDYDASGDPGATDPYFDGVASVLGRHLCGPYGGYTVVKHQLDRGFGFAWQTYAWSGGRLDPRAQLYQFDNSNGSYDRDKGLNEDFAQWDYRLAPPPDPDAMYPAGPFRINARLELSEHATVKEAQRLLKASRANQQRLAVLWQHLKLLRDRVKSEATRDHPASWSLYRRGDRWQGLNDLMAEIRPAKRSLARRLVPHRPVARKQTVYPAHGWLAPGAHLEFQRDDQGKDFVTNWRGPITAPGDGECIAVLHDRAFPSGFGPAYPVVRIDTGDFKGHEFYIGHTTAAVHEGERFRFAHVLSHADQGHDFEGTHGGWVELGEAFGGLPGPNDSTHWYDQLLKEPLRVSG